MAFPKTIAALFFITTVVSSLAQTCSCSMEEVQDNTVQPCTMILGTVVNVATTSELTNAINQANNQGGNMTILIADGTYPVASTSWYPYITASNVVFRSASGNRDDVIITGQGMVDVSPGTENGFYFVGNDCVVADLTIKDLGNHGIAMHGDGHFIHNVKIQNTYEQMIKGTGAGDGADDCIVQCSQFEYTAGIGPQWYIGGLDIHEGDDWIVRDNIFRHIKSPSAAVAEHAVHFWDNSSNNTVERNLIVDCDRGIGFGLGSSPNDGGMIRNNMIYNDGNGNFADVGIGLETSPNTEVYNNTVYIQYANAIEYRFAATNNALIANNLTNKLIKSRNGGQATLLTNYTMVQSAIFIDPANGDLRLANNDPLITDQGTDLTNEVEEDIDQTARPVGAAYDIGAHEFDQSVGLAEDLRKFELNIFPNPASDQLILRSDQGIRWLAIYNRFGQEMPIYQPDLATDLITVDVSAWSPGVYLLRTVDYNGQGMVMNLTVAR